MDSKVLATQLRKPQGELGIYIGNVMNTGNAQMHKLTFESMNIQPKDQILEIGFGNGAYIKEIVEIANDIVYTGIDFSETMVLEAEKFIQANQLSQKAKVIEANVSKIPFRENTFDRIFTLNTLYFWPTPEKDIKEIYRVLKPGGSFYLSFRPREVVEKLEFTKHGFRLYELEEAMELVHSAGFENATSKYQEEQTADFNGVSVTFASICIKASK